MHLSSSLPEQQKTGLQQIVNNYISHDTKRIPGLVFGAVRNDGEPFFRCAAGSAGIASSREMSFDTIFWLASFTKLLTSVSCMQLVERREITLDDADQVERLCPELAEVKVLTQKSDGGFELVDKKRRITLRMLMNHTAGFGYAFEDRKLCEYGRPIGLDDFCGEKDDFLSRPLVNQPGECFQYGTSLDWVGVIIERISGQTLEDYFRVNLTDPLSMTAAFFPSQDMKKNMAYMHTRLADGTLLHRDHLFRKPLTQTSGEKHYAGGHGCYGKPLGFLRLLSILLNDGTDAKTGRKFLKPGTVEEMFKDQISHCPRYSNTCVPVARPELANPTPLFPMPDGHTEGWGLSFSINHTAERSGRAAGSGSWEGLANLYWFVDRTNNLACIIGTQIMPYGDLPVVEANEKLETEIYRLIREESNNRCITCLSRNESKWCAYHNPRKQ